MGYVDEQIGAAQKRISDAIAGKGLRAAIRALQEKSKITDSLKALPARGDITGKRKIGRRTGSAGTTDRNEVSRAYYTTLRELRSSDGLFVLEYYNLASLTFDVQTDRFLDYDPDA